MLTLTQVNLHEKDTGQLDVSSEWGQWQEESFTGESPRDFGGRL